MKLTSVNMFTALTFPSIKFNLLIALISQVSRPMSLDKFRVVILFTGTINHQNILANCIYKDAKFIAGESVV
jgi:ABC-type sugar transport system permease subunit